ncbi:unnamed protein product [Discosporangium mesarthrocarpum]
MIEGVIPAIEARTPKPPSRMIIVQGDGAKAHMGKGIMEAIQDAGGDNNTLGTLPVTSPDLNVNDLCFFHFIQQLKGDVGVANGEDLVQAPVKVFDVYPWETPEWV